MQYYVVPSRAFILFYFPVLKSKPWTVGNIVDPGSTGAALHRKQFFVVSPEEIQHEHDKGFGRWFTVVLFNFIT